MSEPRLEDKLHSLVDHLDAPASTTARHAIGRRTRVLRRRRRTRYTVLGVAVVVVVAGMLSLLGKRPDVETGPSDPGHSVPAITVDLDDWEVVQFREEPDLRPVDLSEDSSYQVFRRQDTLAGPSAFVEHAASSDTVVPMDGQEVVDINGSTGALTDKGRSITLTWNPRPGGGTAYMYAWDLTQDEVVELARSLGTRDDELGYPPLPDDEYGLDTARALPEGIEEDAVAARSRAEDEVAARVTELRSGAATIRAQVDDGGELFFEEALGGFVDADDVEDVSVLDRPAVLIRRADTDVWTVHARLDDGASLQLEVFGVSRAKIDEILDHVEVIDEKDWRQLLPAR